MNIAGIIAMTIYSTLCFCVLLLGAWQHFNDIRWPWSLFLLFGLIFWITALGVK